MSSFTAADWSKVGVMCAGPRVARKAAAVLNGPTGNGSPRIGAAPRENITVPTVRYLAVQRANVEAINLPRVTAPLSSIRPHFVANGNTFRSARATPPQGTGFRSVVVGMFGTVIR